MFAGVVVKRRGVAGGPERARRAGTVKSDGDRASRDTTRFLDAGNGVP